MDPRPAVTRRRSRRPPLALVLIAGCEAANPPLRRPGHIVEAGPPRPRCSRPSLTNVPTYKADPGRTGVMARPGHHRGPGPRLAITDRLPARWTDPRHRPGVLVVGCDDARLFALDARTGDRRGPSISTRPCRRGDDRGRRVLVSTLTNVEARSLNDGTSVEQAAPGVVQPPRRDGVFVGKRGHIDAYAEPAIAERVADLVRSGCAHADSDATRPPRPSPCRPCSRAGARRHAALAWPTGAWTWPGRNLYLVQSRPGRSRRPIAEGRGRRSLGSRGSGDGQFDFQRVEAIRQLHRWRRRAPDARLCPARRTGEVLRARWNVHRKWAGSHRRRQFIDPIDVDVAPDGRCSSSTTNATTSNVRARRTFIDDRHARSAGQLNYTGPIHVATTHGLQRRLATTDPAIDLEEHRCAVRGRRRHRSFREPRTSPSPRGVVLGRPSGFSDHRHTCHRTLTTPGRLG